jgi:hypothetical protein
LEGEVTETYFGDVLQSFANGLQLDLRVKLAIEFMKAHPCSGAPAEGAAYALDLATALIAEAGKRGLLKDLPEDTELNAPTRRHIDRQIRAQVYQQQAAQRISSEPAVALHAGSGELLARRQ